MKVLLARLPCRHSIGLYVDDREIVISRVAATLLGPVEVYRQRVPYGENEFAEVLARVLGPLAARKSRRSPIALGFPVHRVFFSTRPIFTTNNKETPQVLLHEVLKSPNVSAEDMVVDLIRAQPERRKVASIIACRKKYLHGLLTELGTHNVRLALAEPAPCALLRLANHLYRAPRRVRTVIRVFLGQTEGLAVAVAANQPIIWRSFPLPTEEAGTALRSVVRNLETLLVPCGVESTPGAVLIHGRSELQKCPQTARFVEEMGSRLRWTSEPALDPAAIAFGLALGALSPVGEGFDLARTLKPTPSLREIFPWKEAFAQLAMVLGLGVFLSLKEQRQEEEYQACRVEIQRRPWQDRVSEADLQKEKKDLEQSVESIQRFLASRILWTAYTRDVAQRLPVGATLSSFFGVCEMGKDGAAAGKKTFVLKAAAPMATSGAVPREIDDYLTELRKDPLLLRDFPLVDMTDLRWAQPTGRDAKPIASFTVVCLPKVVAKSSPKSEADATGKKGGK